LGVALTLPLDALWLLTLAEANISLPVIFSLLSLDALCYLLIPGIEGFLTGKHSEEGCSGVDGGCLIGIISILAFVVVTTALLIFAYPNYASSARGNGLFVGIALAAAVVHAAGCISGGLLGGWLGGLLGRRYAAAQRRTAAEHQASEAD
jgi:hypothetical protein